LAVGLKGVLLWGVNFAESYSPSFGQLALSCPPPLDTHLQLQVLKHPPLSTSTTTMRSIVSLLLSLATLFALVASARLEIEITSPVECTRKTKKGDNVDMHYRGTLASDGSEFDASYNRGTPLSFQIGAGRVIKG
jgi:hypothetical protein